MDKSGHSWQNDFAEFSKHKDSFSNITFNPEADGLSIYGEKEVLQNFQKFAFSKFKESEKICSKMENQTFR